MRTVKIRTLSIRLLPIQCDLQLAAYLQGGTTLYNNSWGTSLSKTIMCD